MPNTTLDDVKTLPLSVSPAFADHVVRHRLAVPISQHDLADLIGVTLASVCNWERLHGSTSLPLAARAARVLGIDAELRTYNRVVPGPSIRREDLRAQNVGVNGLYQRRTRRAKFTAADSLTACRRFAERMQDAMDKRGISAASLSLLAKLPTGYLARIMEPKDPRQVPLVLCANVAHVLGMSDKLDDYAPSGLTRVQS